MRQTGFYFILIITAILTSALGAEVTARIFYAQEEALDWMRSDERYGYVNRENTYIQYPFLRSDFVMEVNINSIGLRDIEIQESIHFSDGTKRIVAIGDSVTFGFGVNIEERFTTLLEDNLRGKGFNVRVINTGVCGWGTIQETRYAADNFDKFKPDYFLLTFVGNDIINDRWFELGIADSERGVLYFPGKETLRKYSHLYRFLAQKIQPIVVYWYSRILSRDDSLTIDSESASVISESDWARTRSIILDFHDRFLDFNRSGVLIIQSSNASNEDVERNLMTLDNGSSLRYVNLKKEMDELARTNSVRLQYDGHWSSDMHRESAMILTEAYGTYLDSH